MYYIVTEVGGQVVGVTDNMSNTIIQHEADEKQCAVYAIRGEHSGYSAHPKKDKNAN